MGDQKLPVVWKIVVAVTAAGILTGLCWQWFSAVASSSQLETDGVLVPGRITDIDNTRNNSDIYYTYSYNGLNYSEDDDGEKLSLLLRDRLLNKIIPILISKSKPTVSLPLLFKSQYQSFNQDYPDSLRWIDSLR
jgi:hypothetical protein